MFQQPLEQTRSLPQVENIFVSSSPRPRLTLNRCRKGTPNDVVYGGMTRNAPCAEAARQKVRFNCVHRRSTFASTRNTHGESDAESDAGTESVVVDESADSVVSVSA